MERRSAVTAATAASLTFLLGAAGLTANAAILGHAPRTGVGLVSPLSGGQDVILGAVRPNHRADDTPSTTTVAAPTVPAVTAAAAETPDPPDPAEVSGHPAAPEPIEWPHEASPTRPAPTVAPTVPPVAAPNPVPTTVTPVADDDQKPEEQDTVDHPGSHDDD